jgi:glucose-6-phosphate-specific signal transduction histidine kinase
MTKTEQEIRERLYTRQPTAGEQFMMSVVSYNTGLVQTLPISSSLFPYYDKHRWNGLIGSLVNRGILYRAEKSSWGWKTYNYRTTLLGNEYLGLEQC